MNAKMAKARFNAGLSHDQLGTAIGVTGETIRRIENELVRPRPATAKKIADFLEVQPTDLFEFEKDAA